MTYAGHHPNQCFCWGSTKLAQLSGGPFKAIKPTEDLARKENSRCKLSRQMGEEDNMFLIFISFFSKAQLMWLILTFYWKPIFATKKIHPLPKPTQADFRAAFFDISHGTQSIKDWIINYFNFSLQIRIQCTNIPHICHERHEYIRVNFLWPV